MTISNHPRYDAALKASELIGGNFKLIRDRKRALAVDLVAASAVEGMALAEAIAAAKSRMKWTKLESSEQSQMNVLFTAVRIIDGAWKVLPKLKQDAFLEGHLVFSTLSKEIKDAEAKKLEADAEAEAKEEVKAGTAPSMTVDGGAMVGVQTPALSSFGEACAFVAKALDPALALSMSEDDQLALLDLMDVVLAYRAAEAEALSKQAA